MNNKVIEIALSTYGADGGNRNFPWCALWLNGVLTEAGKQATSSLLARSFQDLGEPTSTPKLGDIVVLWRESPESWKGHAGFFVRETEEKIFILGGNQDGIVKIKAYPKWQLLDYRTNYA